MKKSQPLVSIHVKKKKSAHLQVLTHTGESAINQARKDKGQRKLPCLSLKSAESEGSPAGRSEPQVREPAFLSWLPHFLTARCRPSYLGCLGLSFLL